MKAFVRDNLMIVASVALPVVVVILLALATVVPRWLVDPPQYDFLMTADWPALAGRRVDPAFEAPDGYVFERPDTSGGGLFAELFGAGRNRYAARLRKDGAVVRVRAPIEAPYYYYNLRFLGWIAE